jgi:hypothetical protein
VIRQVPIVVGAAPLRAATSALADRSDGACAPGGEAATDTPLRIFDMVGTVAVGAAVLRDRLYIPWGVLTNTGGVQAWTLP